MDIELNALTFNIAPLLPTNRSSDFVGTAIEIFLELRLSYSTQELLAQLYTEKISE
jgi:hypothetical protein